MENSLGGKIAKAFGLENREPSALEQAIVDRLGSKNLETVVRATDVVVSMAPGASTVKDIYEAATGYNVMTGENLSAFDRGVAVFGVLTLGAGSSILRGTQAISKAARVAEEGRAIEQIVGGTGTIARVAERGSNVEHVVSNVRAASRSAEDVRNSIYDVKAIAAHEANSRFPRDLRWEPPFSTGSQVREFKTNKELDFVRVFTDREKGGFMVRAEEISGMTPAEIQKHLALDAVPTHMIDVKVPPHTPMLTGYVGPQPQFGFTSTGGIQYYVPNWPQMNVRFENPRQLSP